MVLSTFCNTYVVHFRSLTLYNPIRGAPQGAESSARGRPGGLPESSCGAGRSYIPEERSTERTAVSGEGPHWLWTVARVGGRKLQAPLSSLTWRFLRLSCRLPPVRHSEHTPAPGGLITNNCSTSAASPLGFEDALIVGNRADSPCILGGETLMHPPSCWEN